MAMYDDLHEDLNLADADETEDEVVDGFEGTPIREASRPPVRGARLEQWGDRHTRRPHRGAKTPRHKTAHRGKSRGEFAPIVYDDGDE